MLSRWTDFLNTDGEKKWRKRDEEFFDEIKSKKELLKKWNDGWHCVYAAIKPLKNSDLTK